ncbi:TolB family protein [Homoserinimonas sp. A447]
MSQLIVKEVGSDDEHVLLETDFLIESPNWTPDGAWIIVNGGGKLYRLAADGTTGLTVIPTGDVANINNDHILSPDGTTVYFSAAGHLFSVPIDGGTPVKISNDHPADRNYSYWLHGVSPDNQTLAYVSVEPEGSDPRGRRNLVTIPVAGGPDKPLSRGVVPFDGPEFSPDGTWIYYNSEEAAERPGHSQLFRMRPDGSGREQLTFDERVNWFPHLSPDGSLVVYLSYEAGTISHPADVDLEIRVMSASGGPVTTISTLFGGQGTLNTNSWAPDSKRFAYVAYPAAIR